MSITRYSDEFQTKEQALDDARASAAISHHLENERQSLKRQLAASNAEIERLRRLEAAVVGDTLIAQVLSEPHACHDDKCCDWCEAREAGIDKYHTRLLEIAFGKDHPRKETPHAK